MAIREYSLEEPVVDMGIILKRILETRSGGMWNGFNYIRKE